jgi:NAD(P)-dependent dehydrogenase (short-subunit alcohol dehydrogenase family)
MSKSAVLIGSSGNLGPIWEDELKKLGYEVFCMDISTGYSVRQDLYFDLFNNEILGNNIPHVVLYNAAIDNPPSDGVTFFTNVDDVVNVNLLGAVRACKKFLPMMIDNGGGIFVYVSSIQSVVGADWRNYDGDFQKPVGYNISKAGINQLVRSIAVQFGRKNIRAVSIGFAAVDTGKFKEPFKSKFLSCLPLGRFISPESCRKTLKAAIEIPELTGQLVMVDGGYTSW